ncbi:hypothetical protein R3P38DRAFT_3422525 [Favolaschia claudopus]|uniref:WH1-domain-containing protein n=1 Tax=Favolaschia claudopus TaxID=2862362 RepID=A0AAW0D8L6_9AGAR
MHILVVCKFESQLLRVKQKHTPRTETPSVSAANAASTRCPLPRCPLNPPSTQRRRTKSRPLSPAASNKILFAALARIYYAHPDPNQWSYSGLQGALAIVRDTTKNTYAFRLVDLDGTRGVIWEFELYNGLEYFPDRAFFHSFAADECMVGFVFADEREAKSFWKKVTTKKEAKSKPASEKKKKASKGGKIDKSMISGPASGSFVHVAHMGYDEDQGFTSTGVDPSWTAFLGQLENSGIDKKVIDQEMEFIKDFARKHQQQQAAAPTAKKSKPPPPPSRRTHAPTDSTSSIAAAPPPPPPPRGGRASQVPPAPPMRPAPAATPAPPPPPPMRPAGKSPAVPAPPPRPTSAAPPAPPPPPRPPVSNGVPPPPPASPSSTPSRRRPSASTSAPATPSGAVLAGLPPPQPGRNALLDSIQGKGVHSLRKTDGPAPRSPAVEEPTSPAAGGGGADLTTALRDALIAKRANMGDSDDEEDEEDWD